MGENLAYDPGNAQAFTLGLQRRRNLQSMHDVAERRRFDDEKFSHGVCGRAESAFNRRTVTFHGFSRRKSMAKSRPGKTNMIYQFRTQPKAALPFHPSFARRCGPERRQLSS
jgi:hypothetical protein